MIVTTLRPDASVHSGNDWSGVVRLPVGCTCTPVQVLNQKSRTPLSLLTSRARSNLKYCLSQSNDPSIRYSVVKTRMVQAILPVAGCFELNLFISLLGELILFFTNRMVNYFHINSIYINSKFPPCRRTRKRYPKVNQAIVPKTTAMINSLPTSGMTFG